MTADTPFVEGYLPSHYGHEIYFAAYGAKGQSAILNIHGGPGLGSQAKYAAQFDLEKFTVITFDQRGCGRSRFGNPILNNTVDLLVSDIERLRSALSVDSWYINGGSWGATLALAYTQRFRRRVRGLILASTFLGDSKRMRWLYGYPDTSIIQNWPVEFAAYRAFLQRHGVRSKTDLAHLARLLASSDWHVKEEIVRNLINIERRLYVHGAIDHGHPTVTDTLILTKRIYMHYACNNFFLADGQISDDSSSFAQLPIIMIHGDRDLVCPICDILAFAELNPNIQVRTLINNGHSFTSDAKRQAVQQYSEFLSNIP